MNVRITEQDLNEVLYEESFPDEFRSDTGITERTASLSHRLGEMCMKGTWFEGVLINQGNMSLYNKMNFYMETDLPVVEMHFSLTGETSMRFSGDRFFPHTFAAAKHNIMYSPGFSGSMRMEPNSETHQFFEVQLTEKFFQKLVHEECTPLFALASKIERKEMAVISNVNMDITTTMYGIISDMVNCERKGTLKRLYLESKVLELLMLQTEQFESGAKIQKQQQFPAQDIEKIHHAKWLIEQHADNPYSLLELARAVGLNDFKLKKGFREVWGTTVFGYLHELRMKQAKKMLAEEGKTVGEAADKAGYKNAHHFTAAFKKYFGCLPSQLKH